MRRSSRLLIVTTVVVHGACATEPAALSVDDVSFGENELLGLAMERRGVSANNDISNLVFV